ncbi:uncharacterized protein [Epargyreus clarus]|uniref:uncharacterized protein n=1 Tax=Epargyreus clarus TaxID=520877 RepID=UPI003C2BBF17
MDFKIICRICLKANKIMFDIFTSFCIKRNIFYSEMLTKCTIIKPSEEDGLPRQICKECIRQLKRSFTFNTQCAESEETLKKYLETKDDLDLKPSVDSNVKDEKCAVKAENRDSSNSVQDLVRSILEDSKESIKLEPSYNDNDDDRDNSSWDAEDDNILLEIKMQKTIRETVNGEDGPKKKRGRKKKAYTEGGTQLPPDSKLPHQCDVCGKILSNKSNLKAHKICHTDLRPYKCDECPASFKGHSALFQHKKIHSGETPYHCEYCPKRFSRRTGLVNHIRMHTGEKLYSCDICFKNFVQSAQLSIHMKRHMGEKSYLCQDCGKGFPIKADLRVHQRIHNGEKPYACHLCAKTFATSGNLSIHIRIHNKEVRYKCKECHRGFVTCSAYNVHVKRHKGQRDYHCECGKTFYTSSALKQHKVVHTGEKNYQCKICGRKFSQTSHLSRHFRRDHAKPNVPVPSSDQYKVILPQGRRVFDFLEPKMPQDVTENVKCEGS